MEFAYLRNASFSSMMFSWLSFLRICTSRRMTRLFYGSESSSLNFLIATSYPRIYLVLMSPCSWL